MRQMISISLWMIVLLASVNAVAGPPTNEIRCTTCRPIRDVVTALQEQLGCIITYEDPNFKSKEAVESLFPGGPIGPRFRTFQFVYDSTHLDKLAVIEQILKTYNSQSQTDAFAVRAANDKMTLFNVYPTHSAGVDGKLAPQRSLLDPVIPVQTNGSYTTAAAAIVRALSGHDRLKLSISDAPGRGIPLDFDTDHVTLIAEKQPGWKWVNTLVEHYNASHERPISWWLLRDPVFDPCDIFFYFPEPLSEAPVTNTVTLELESDRPLADALTLMQQELDCPIVYEDPPYACSCEVMRDQAGRVQALRGGTLDFSYRKGTPAKDILAACLKAYGSQDNPGDFYAQHLADAFYVLPARTRTVNKKWVEYKPILQAPVSISATNWPVNKIIATLCASLSEQTGRPINVGEIQGADRWEPMTYKATHRPAAECLIEITRAAHHRIVWQLQYDPRTEEHTLIATGDAPTTPAPGD